MAPPEDALTLANLPSDIIRKIVKMESHSITGMRLIALSWYTPIHVIKRLQWKIDYNGHLMTLNLSSVSREYFGIEQWHHRSTTSNANSEEVEIDSPLLISPDHFIPPPIASFFSKCMAIGRLEIDLIRSGNGSEIDEIISIIFQFPVQILSFNVNHSMRSGIESKILNLLRGGSVKKRLVLPADMCNFGSYWMRNGVLSDQTCGPFLFSAVKFVPEVEIVTAARMSRAQNNERRVYWVQVVAALNSTGRVRAVLHIDELVNRFRVTVTVGDNGTVSVSGSSTAFLSTLV